MLVAVGGRGKRKDPQGTDYEAERVELREDEKTKPVSLVGTGPEEEKGWMWASGEVGKWPARS